jgi:hypothetical protein
MLVVTGSKEAMAQDSLLTPATMHSHSSRIHAKLQTVTFITRTSFPQPSHNHLAVSEISTISVCMSVQVLFHAANALYTQKYYQFHVQMYVTAY